MCAAAAAKLLQSCPTLCDPIDGSPPGCPPWDSPGKNTGVGCLFLLQCMKVKSEREVVQSCPTLSDPMDCSLPGSSIHGIFQARVLEWGVTAFSVKAVCVCVCVRKLYYLFTLDTYSDFLIWKVYCTFRISYTSLSMWGRDSGQSKRQKKEKEPLIQWPERIEFYKEI